MNGSVALVATLLLVGGCGGTGGSSWSPETADLMFTSNRDGNTEIYLLTAGTSDWVNLTRDSAGDNWPEWSPDGRRIAFQSNRQGNLDIWVMEADGSNPTQLTTNPEHDYLPAWSPDGSEITFASWRSEPGDRVPAVHIYVMNADGTGQRRLFAESPGTSTGARWAREGRTFLLSRKTDQTGADIFLLDEAGKIVRQLTDDAASNGAAVFSPDGTGIAFYSDEGETSSLIVMDVDGSNRRSIIDVGQNWYPRWSPDGRWLLYTAAAPGGAEEDLDVRAIALDGEAESILLAGGPDREAEGRWRPVQ